MRRIIIDYYNGEFHFQFWEDGTLKLTMESIVIDEGILEIFLIRGYLPLITE